MAAEVNNINPQEYSSQNYQSQDLDLISSFDVNTSLSSGSYIELSIYDPNKNLIFTEYNFTNYTVVNDGQSAGNEGEVSEIVIDPEKALLDSGFNQGTYVTYFNFLNEKVGSDIQNLYITEISSDRTELRLDSTSLTNQDIIEQTEKFIQERESSSYFLDFYLNFGDNKLYIANNISLDNDDPTNPTILIKLYEALPEEFNINSQLWIVTSIEDPIAYQVIFEDLPIIIDDTVPLKGPNFNIDLKDKVNNSTLSLSYTDLISTTLTSSQNQLNSLLEEKEIDINVDYTDFSKFIHFSSAKTRIENFYYKVQLIEQYSSSISTLSNTINNDPSASIAIYQSKIDNIITNFDGYDYYLYYSDSSWAYPKTTTEPPYQLASSTSDAVLYWLGSTNEYSPYYGGLLLSASEYDNSNKDNLLFSIPEYLREDSNNDQYMLFIDMVAQHYDNIWIYYNDVSQKYDADNRLDYGISKDLVADAIRDFGVKLYQNNFSNVDLFTAFLGLTPDGALFPFPNITGSLPTPSGFEYVDTLISASNDYLPLDDVNKSLYKRIYHNLPYLLKSKGTLPGLRALITSYGIPDTILRINEYGGKDKVNSNDWDYWQNEFNYAYKTPLTGALDEYLYTEWPLNLSWGSPDNVPSTLTFRFKTEGLPTSSIPYSQSLWLGDAGCALELTYTGSGYTSGSYAGSIIDPYYQYATLTFYPDAINYPNSTASIYLPFFDGGWWSTMITRTGSNFELYAGNKIYEGGDNGTLLGFYTSSLITEDSTAWISSGYSYFGLSTDQLFGPINGQSYQYYTGSYQEIRYYSTALSESVFKDFIMNPYSIEGNSLNSGPNELAFRIPLGGELYTGSFSIHPKITGSWSITSSFASNDSSIYQSGLYPPNYYPLYFQPNEEYFFYDQPIAGIKNTVSDKIRLESNSLPTGSTLSPFRSLSQTIEASASYTPNINYLEVAFSPQNEINEDIMDQLGFFNIGDYIGDPIERFSGNSYPDLDNLRNAYFEKYIKNYNLVDFIRLIKFFDNSLFKMIKDFVPARTSLASGVVIKQHLLERNKYPQPQVSWEDLDISGTLKPQWNDYNPGTVENFSGGTAGSFEIFNGVDTSPYGPNGTGPENIFGITQSWDETYPSLLGEITVTHDSQEEFYDGEFDGSVILVTDQVLNQAYPLENASFEYTPVLYGNNLYQINSPNSTFTENQFLNPLTAPDQGEILVLLPRFTITILPPFFIKQGNVFVKIHKFDCNGVNNTNSLGQITNLLIKYTNDSSYTNYTILNINEYQTYYLYEISNSTVPVFGLGLDNYIKDYYVSSSITSSYSLAQVLTPQGFPTIQVLTGWDVPLGNTLGYFDSSSGYYTLQNTPNIPIQITASIVTSGSAGGSFRLMLLRQGEYSSLAISGFGAGANVTSTITASYYGLDGDQIYLRAYRGASGTFSILKSGSLLLTQSISPTASVCDSVILEPYITTPNFYNSDENALLNSVEDARLSSTYQDIDYSTGITIPTNFDLLVEGTAQKAAVQDSNYTTKRHIIPRYEGSRSTSQNLNFWTSNDEGTYGKLPSVESLKTYVAYAETIGGYAPERMNTSGVSIKYFISEDGDLIAPNTSPNVLGINQQTFISGENIKIESLGGGSSAVNPFLPVFRGGASIEPVIYNQIRHYENPPMSFASTLSFTDRNPNSSAAILDYTATLSPSNSQTYYPIQTSLSGIFMNEVVSKGVNADAGGVLVNTNQYTVTQDVIDENVDLVIDVKLICYRDVFTLGSINAQVYRVRGTSQGIGPVYSSYINAFQTITIEFSYTIPRANLQANDQYGILLQAGQDYSYYRNDSTFKISTNPYPTPALDVTNLWFSSSDPQYANSIYTTSSQFIQYLNSSNIYQQDIAGSGFNSIVLPVSIERGDEFRFEGDETKTFMVDRTEIISSSLSGPRLYVHLNNQITGSGIDINEFVLRRYVDNSSGLLLDGLKPSGTSSPYLVKPQYMSDKMEQNIGKYIEDFTQKGLL